jgi:hypothetical protein
MRTVVGATLLVGMVSACSGGNDVDPVAPIELPFGPYTLAPGEEVEDQCVQISLHNDDYLFINSVELETGPGFHHSNWLYVPEHVFPGEDGTYTCDDRNFDQAVGAIFGGVLFAQSTQLAHEVQAFPPGVVVKIPPRSKLVSTIHLLNPTDGELSLAPKMTLAPIAEADVTTELAGISFLNQALALPPNMGSKFTLDCDLAETHQRVLGRDPDFNIYYALAHYHDLGTALTVEAVRPDGTTAMVFTTANAVGDSLGGLIEPLFSMQGFTKLRFSCEFFNPRSDVVRWGVGDQEMCVFLAFSDSAYNFGGGVTAVTEPLNPEMVGNLMTYSNPCSVFANDARR